MTVAEGRHQLQRHDPQQALPPGEADRNFCQNSSGASAPAESVSWPRLNGARLAAEGQPRKDYTNSQKASLTAPYSDIVLMTENIKRGGYAGATSSLRLAGSREGEREMQTARVQTPQIRSMQYSSFDLYVLALCG